MSHKIEWLALGDEKLRKSLALQEQELLLHPWDQRKKQSEVIRSFTEGYWGEQALALPFSWDFSSVKDRFLPFWLQSFALQAYMMDEYFRTGDAALYQLLFAWVFDWIEAHPEVNRSDTWAWHDDATGRRAIYFSIFLIAFEKVLSEQQIRLLRKSLDLHADLLRDEGFYRLFHNHGLYQDLALAGYSLCCRENSAYWSRLSAARSKVYLETRISDEGVHLEHSPRYQADITRAIAWLALVFREIEPVYSKELTLILDNMADYNYWMTMPDGMLPSIGDSPREEPDRVVRHWEEDSVSTGNMRVFSHSGYGIIRKGKNSENTRTWMVLLAATHSEVHKHNDDLSFLLYHGGELITEAGSRNYNYFDPLTEYCYSSYGHNVLFVDGRGWNMKPTHLPLLEKNAFKTGIIAWEDTPEMSSITGRQIRFPGVIQVRTLRYDKKSETVMIEERITLEKPSALKLIFHIAPQVIAKETCNGFSLIRGAAVVARISIESVARVRAVITDAGEPPWRTEIFWGRENAQNGSLLVIDWEGDTGLNLLRLKFELL